MSSRIPIVALSTVTPYAAGSTFQLYEASDLAIATPSPFAIPGVSVADVLSWVGQSNYVVFSVTNVQPLLSDANQPAFNVIAGNGNSITVETTALLCTPTVPTIMIITVFDMS